MYCQNYEIKKMISFVLHLSAYSLFSRYIMKKIVYGYSEISFIRDCYVVNSIISAYSPYRMSWTPGV